MPEPKKVAFDPYNAMVASDGSPDAMELQMRIPIEDGGTARVKIKVEAPSRLVGEDGSKQYEMNVSSTQEVTFPDRTKVAGGERRRGDGLYWEIPANFPGGIVGLLEHEGAVKEFILSRFKENKTFVDIGANVGGYSVRAASWGMKVYSFEPNPENLAVLKKNIEINNLTINVLPFAIGSKNEKTHLSPHDGLSRITKDEGLEVEMRTLDSFDLPAADLLKIDVEGHELEVLRGARKTLEKFRPVIMIEMHYWVGAESEAELFEILRGLGYRLEYIDRYRLGRHLAALPRKAVAGSPK